MTVSRLAPPPREAPEAWPRCQVLGVQVWLVTIDALLGYMAGAIQDRRQVVVGIQNLHAAYMCQVDAPMAAMLRAADLVFVDGTPLIWAARLQGHAAGPQHRHGFTDFRESFFPVAAARGWRVFYLGSAPGVAAAGADVLRGRFPGLEIATHHGHFDVGPDSHENAAVLAAINGFNPDVVMVGMGMPRQERWIQANRARLGACVLMPTGAGMDYVAGVLPTPPAWMGPAGIEWLFRLLWEPRRLAVRYLVEPLLLAALLTRKALLRNPPPL